jgi:hypothetical protein
MILPSESAAEELLGSANAISLDPDLRSLQQFFEERTTLRAERSGPGVMLFREFFRAGLRSDKNDRQIEMRIAVVRIVCQSLKDFRFCLLLPAFLAGRDAQIIVSSSALWIDLNRPR